MAGGRMSKKFAKILLGFSIFVLIISLGLLISFEKIYNVLLPKYIALGQGSLATKIWQDIPLPIHERLYFFNITNSDAFLAGREPLNVTEVGPYTFNSHWIKPNPKWNDNNTVSYREVRTYHFVPEMSIGTEDDLIYTLNGPMIIGANIVPHLLRIPFDLFCIAMGESVITQKSIRELAYGGYDDPIIKRATYIKPKIPYKDGRFSWLYGKNATDDGLFTVFTGTDDQSKTNFINNWNGEEKLNFWSEDTCNMLNGTSIETGPPIKGPQDSYTFFQSFFCRSLTFNYTEDVKHFNIDAKRFRPTYDVFANSSINPDNECFEVNKEHPSGILDISPCQFGAPVFISFPHFHLADSFYLKSVNGLNPDDSKHGSYIDVEPITGISINLLVRFQINIEIEKIPGFHFFNDVTKGIFPVFWAELSLEIDEDLASFLKRNVKDPKIIAYSILSILLLFSLIGIVISVVILCRPTLDEAYPLIGGKNGSESRNCCGYKRNSEFAVEEKAKNFESEKSVDNFMATDESNVLVNQTQFNNSSHVQEKTPNSK